MNQIVDQTSDRSLKTLVQMLTSVEQVPEFVKQAAVTDLAPNSPDEIPDELYGDPISRKFPCHNPAAAWVSSVFFLKQASQMDQSTRNRIQTRIQQCLKFWQVPEPTLKTAERPVVPYAWQDPRYPSLPLASRDQVYRAAEWLDQHYKTLPYDRRLDVAERIVKRASDLGIDPLTLPESVTQLAGYGFNVPTGEVVEQLMLRLPVVAANQNPGFPAAALQQAIKTASAVLESTSPQQWTQNLLRKIASVMAAIDEAVGMNYQQTYLIQVPETVCFRITTHGLSKAANESVLLKNGKIVMLDQLQQIPDRGYFQFFGPGFVRKINNPDGTRNLEALKKAASELTNEQADLLTEIIESMSG